MVDYFGNPDIEGKDLKKHIAISSEPANILAIEYAGSEVFSNSNNKAVNLTCTDYPFILKALGKKQERKKLGKVLWQKKKKKVKRRNTAK